VAEQPTIVVKKMNMANFACEVKFDIPIDVIEGITKQQFDADINLYQAVISANPLLNPFVTFAAASSATANFIATVRVEYICDLWERQTLTQS